MSLDAELLRKKLEIKKSEKGKLKKIDWFMKGLLSRGYKFRCKK